MAYCSRCGVEVEARATTCPLCGASIQRLDPEPAEPPRYPARAPAAGPSARAIRGLVWGVGSAALASAALVCLTVDLLLGGGPTWSLPTLAGLGVAWAFLGLVLRFARRPVVVVGGQALTTCGFLLVVDGRDGRLDWFVPLGLPVVTVITAAALAVWLAVRLVPRPATIVAPAVLAAGAAASLGIDLLVGGWAGTPGPSWSLVVLAAAAAPLVLLFWVHVRLARRVDLRRVLHS